MGGMLEALNKCWLPTPCWLRVRLSLHLFLERMWSVASGKESVPILCHSLPSADLRGGPPESKTQEPQLLGWGRWWDATGGRFHTMRLCVMPQVIKSDV